MAADALQNVLLQCKTLLATPSREGIDALKKALVLESYEMQQISPARAAKALQVARAEYQNDDHELDDGADVSVTDNGVWVAGWYWVSDEDLKNHA